MSECRWSDAAKGTCPEDAEHTAEHPTLAFITCHAQAGQITPRDALVLAI